MMKYGFEQGLEQTYYNKIRERVDQLLIGYYGKDEYEALQKYKGSFTLAVSADLYIKKTIYGYTISWIFDPYKYRSTRYKKVEVLNWDTDDDLFIPCEIHFSFRDQFVGNNSILQNLIDKDTELKNLFTLIVDEIQPFPDRVPNLCGNNLKLESESKKSSDLRSPTPLERARLEYYHLFTNKGYRKI